MDKLGSVNSDTVSSWIRVTVPANQSVSTPFLSSSSSPGRRNGEDSLGRLDRVYACDADVKMIERSFLRESGECCGSAWKLSGKARLCSLSEPVILYA